MAVSVLWFRRSLRLADNAALIAASEAGRPILPVYIEDELDRGGASRWWLHHSLAALGEKIAEAGGTLVFARGNPASVLAKLADDHAAATVFTTRRFEPEARRQEDAVRSALAGNATLEISDDSLLRPPEAVTTKTGGTYKVFTPFYRASTALGEPPVPLPFPDDVEWYEGTSESLTLDELGLLPQTPDWAGGLRETWTAGEDAAHSRLAGMADKIQG